MIPVDMRKEQPTLRNATLLEATAQTPNPGCGVEDEDAIGRVDL